ncbi:MAG: VOC family protein [Hyphomicrobiales bacterium]|jgi:hypothetical protein|nr:VOC family protein [Hyphomicrobiales bacterium]
MADHGHFYWNELMTRDVEGAKEFYGKTIGWSFQGMPMENGTYWIAMVGETPVGGIMEMKGDRFEGVPPHWFSYIAVDDVDARVTEIKAGGGEVLRPVFEVPGVGRIAILKDASGAVIGWITPAR